MPEESLSYIFDEVGDEIYSFVIWYDQKWIVIDDYGVQWKILYQKFYEIEYFCFELYTSRST